MVEQGLNTSIIGRAAAKGLLSINAVNIRDYTTEKHGKVDDYPYGGGAGMLMQAQPVYDACMAVKGDKGKNTINFTYVPPGIKDGILISTLALIFFIIYIGKQILYSSKKRRLSTLASRERR